MSDVPSPSAYTLVFAGAVSIAFLAASRGRTIALVSVVMAAGAVHQIVVLQCATREFWAHVGLGLVVCGGTQYALRGDGGPIAISWLHGVILALISFILIAFEVSETGIRTLHSMAHIVVELIMFSIGVFAMIDGGLRTADAVDAVRLVTTLRTLHDPLALSGIGLVLRHHLHDRQPLAVRFHEVQGTGTITLGGATFLCALAHARLPRTDRAATALRLLVATLWLLNGLWLYHMAYFLYLLPGRHGLQHLLWPTADIDEAVYAYLAIDMWLAVIIVCVWQWRLAAPGVEVAVACGREDDGSKLGSQKRESLEGLEESVPLTIATQG